MEEIDRTNDPPPRIRRVPWVQGAIVAAVGLAVAALALTIDHGQAAGAASANCGGSSPHLTVQGAGRSSGPPNVLDLQAEVDVTGLTASAALSQDNATAAAVVAAIEAAGVNRTDVSTTDLTVSPNYDYHDGRSVITDYAVSNSIAVTVVHLGDAGSVIDAASNAGGNALSIDSLSFSLSDPRTLENEARRDAVRQAATHAAAMAGAAGERLAGLCALTDQSSLGQGPSVPLATPAYAGAASVPLEGGTEEASAQVTLVYALEPSDT